MRRRPDWPSRLEEHLQAARNRSFRWGRHDCAMFACGAVEAMTGADPAAPFRGRYRSEAGARRLLRAAGGGLAELVARQAQEQGAVEVPPLRAQRGDLCLAAGPDGLDGLGVCVGGAAAFMRPDGLAFLPIGRVKRAWRI